MNAHQSLEALSAHPEQALGGAVVEHRAPKFEGRVIVVGLGSYLHAA